ncbi:helix-turn-helix domain-containing protein [Bacteroidota bacterium]
MITREEIIKNETFWTETIQNKIYSDLVTYIKKNKVSQKKLAEKLDVSKGYVSQILSGENLNFQISTLVKICIAIEKVPNINFEEIDSFIKNDMKNDLGSIQYSNDGILSFEIMKDVKASQESKGVRVIPFNQKHKSSNVIDYPDNSDIYELLEAI